MKNRNFKIAMVALAISLLVPVRQEGTPGSKGIATPFQRDEQSLAGMVKQERSKFKTIFDNFAIYYLS